MGDQLFKPVEPNETVPAAVGVGIYALILLWCCQQLFRLRLRVLNSRVKLVLFTDVFIVLFTSIRLTWITMEMLGQNNRITYCLNRVAFLFFFTLFTFLVFYWAEIYHQLKVKNQLLDRLRPAFITTNVVLYLTEIGFMIATLIETEKAVPLYNINIYLISVLSLLICCSFCVYGLALYRRYVSRPGVSFENKRRLEKIAIVAVVVSLCFLVRFVAFGYRPVTSMFMPTWLYLLLLYYVPECVPVIVHLWVMRKGVRPSLSNADADDRQYRQMEANA